MEYQELLKVALDFATAVLLGALVGIEREKRKAEEGEVAGIAGLVIGKLRRRWYEETLDAMEQAA